MNSPFKTSSAQLSKLTHHGVISTRHGKIVLAVTKHTSVDRPKICYLSFVIAKDKATALKELAQFLRGPRGQPRLDSKIKALSAADTRTIHKVLELALARKNSTSRRSLVKNSAAQALHIKDFLTLYGTPFQLQVWQALLKIPAGETRTYQQVAQSIGKPKAVRAVASAIAKNNIAMLIPCHRVVPASGGIGKYRWGSDTKLALLKSEGFSF